MGIPKFYGSWVLKRRNKVTTKTIPSNVTSISLDLNSIFHMAAQTIYGYGEGDNRKRLEVIKNMSDKELEEEHFELITNIIYRIVTYVRVQKYLVLAVDGVAPLAKISQQRTRRYRSAMSIGGMRFDPNAITPGTDFMIRLDRYLQKWIIDNRIYLPKEVVYSSHLVPGEGEQKIFDLIRDRKVGGYGAHLVYGLDADLIILSVISRMKGIYLLREKTNKANEYEDLISIDGLRQYIYNKMGLNTALDDFAVLTFFLGNDFLPTSPMFNGDLAESLDFLIEIYNTFRRSLTYNGEIVMSNLIEFIRILSRQEKTRMIEVYKNKPKLGFKLLDSAITESSYVYNDVVNEKIDFDKDIFSSLWYLKAFGPATESLEMVKLLPDELIVKLFEPSSDKIGSLVQEWITGFAWTFIYYKQGYSKVNPNYLYSNNYAPLISDVVLYYMDRRGPVKREEVKMDYSLPVLLQMLAVLPPQSSKQMPEGLRKLVETDSPIADMFPRKVFVDTDGKDMERLGLVQIAVVEPLRLFSIADMIDIPDDILELYQETENMTYITQDELTLDKDLDFKEIDIKTQVIQDKGDEPEIETYVEGKVGGKVVRRDSIMNDYKRKEEQEDISMYMPPSN